MPSESSDRAADRLAITRTFSDASGAEPPPSGPPPAGPASDPAYAATAIAPPGGPAGHDPSVTGDMIGQRIGGYRVEKVLGRGGMGVVFLAVHERLGQRAVVKTLKPELSHSPHYAQRFFTEARAASLAQHPGLVKVFDFGQLADKTLYILMEFLDGETLADRLARRRLDPAAALRLAGQLARTVGAAHDRGIAHRDLKPANVFVVADPEAPGGERVKVLDFGLAKISGSVLGDGGPGSTASGAIMGTPVYMSPEQCRGLANTDGKTDVYALGVMLFEMLSGTPPFRADTAGDLIAMHIGQPAPSLVGLAPQSSPALASLVARMLAKDPATRPDMGQVAEHLVALASVETAAVQTARRPTPRWRLGLAALLLGMVIAGGVVGARLRRPTAAPMVPIVPVTPAPILPPVTSAPPVAAAGVPAPVESPPPPVVKPAPAGPRRGPRPSTPRPSTPRSTQGATPPAPARPPAKSEEDVDVPALR